MADQNNLLVIVNKLQEMSSYVEFRDDMLPDGLTVDQLLSKLSFLSPVILLLHGSKISHRKFSNKNYSDLDLVCVSVKAAFWPIDKLMEEAQYNLRFDKIKIDLSIITNNGFSSIIDGNSSISRSFANGFSIIHYEGN